MRGHEHVIAMRKMHQRPAVVFVNDYPCETDWFEHGEHATVSLDGDQPELLDLRFLQGITVSVSSRSVDRAKRLAEACKQAGASRVAACAWEHIGHGRTRDLWADIWVREVVHG